MTQKEKRLKRLQTLMYKLFECDFEESDDEETWDNTSIHYSGLLDCYIFMTGDTSVSGVPDKEYLEKHPELTAHTFYEMLMNGMNRYIQQQYGKLEKEIISLERLDQYRLDSYIYYVPNVNEQDLPNSQRISPGCSTLDGRMFTITEDNLKQDDLVFIKNILDEILNTCHHVTNTISIPRITLHSVPVESRTFAHGGYDLTIRHK